MPKTPTTLYKPQNPQTVFTLLFYPFSPSVAREKEPGLFSHGRVTTVWQAKQKKLRVAGCGLRVAGCQRQNVEGNGHVNTIVIEEAFLAGRSYAALHV